MAAYGVPVGPFAAACVQVEDALGCQIAERRLDDRRQSGRRLLEPAMERVERSSVVVRRFHYASREKPPSITIV